MPKTPINYNKTIIYKLVCNDIEIKDIYVGATTDMIRRKAHHKYCCTNTAYKNKVYQTIRQNGGFKNWTMLEVEKFSCNNKMESDIRERYWLESLSCNLNMHIPSRDMKEYYQYYQNNKK
jgi:hypothetical protein